ncbi:hypothetical protein HPT27_08390 [Permianibacter sp. IMCC34836]|uniref:tetratricopeptide repeat protein n=1 Tax=Permianibacter fluminis TaxID=2738515 RepID=UPI001553BEBE|nr:hypothetical protein [Permianibacter fluminis]NQD37040.1 hypothetical protein [Permianibacter fluminis]
MSRRRSATLAAVFVFLLIPLIPLIALLAPPPVSASETALLDLAAQQHFPEPREAKLLQYRLLNYLQQVGALYDQPESSKRQADIAEAFDTLGKTYGRLGMPVMAAFYYDQALRLEPNSSHHKADLGAALLQIGELDAGKRLLLQSLQGDDHADHDRSVAVGLIQLGAYPDADRIFRDVIKTTAEASDRHYAYLMLSLLQPLLGDASRNALPPPPKAERNQWPALAAGWFALTDETDLTAYLTALQSKDSDRFREQLCEALFYRGWYWQGVGKPDRARDYFKAVLQMNLPSFDETQLARYFLNRMQPIMPASRGSSFDPMPVS